MSSANRIRKFGFGEDGLPRAVAVAVTTRAGSASNNMAKCEMDP